MYGRGNYASQFGQGLQRPMPPYQQPPAGHLAAPHFQPGQPFALQPVMQQAGPPHAGPAHASGFPHRPPAPPNFRQQGPPGSLQPPLTVHSGASAQHPYSAGQHNFTSGTQHPHHVGLLPPPPPSIGPSRVPPPPPSQGSGGYGPPGPQSTPSNQPGIHHMPLPPPPPPPPPTAAGFFSPANFESAMQQASAGSHMPPQPPPLPPSSPPKAPPPPSFSPSSVKLSSTATNAAAGSFVKAGDVSSSDQVRESESSGNIKTDSHNRDGTSISDENLSLKQSILLELPPPKPTDDKVVRNIEVLCQFIAKNGPEFEDMARKKESGNPEFNFLVGGDVGSEASCAHEYYLWMKKKCAILNDADKVQGPMVLSQRHADVEPSAIPNSFANARAAHSPTDSDVDMEDDITQFDKEPGAYNSIENLKPEPVSTGEILEIQNQGNALQYLRDSNSALKLSPLVKPREDAETKPEHPSGQSAEIDSSFRLIQNYASDDTSEDEGETCREEGISMAVSPPRESGVSTSLEDIEYSNTDAKSGLKSEPRIVQYVTSCLDGVLTKELDDSEAVQRRIPETVTKVCSPGRNEADFRYDRAPSNSNGVFHGKYGSGSSNVDAVSTYKDIDRESKKNTSTALKVDEFGRLAKEGASESESDDSHVRRRRRRDRSRSRSQSPSDRRRRRSPRRSPRTRKDKRSRSRSWSPKRRKSRSRSPYRPGGDHGGENLRRGKLQTRECFDFLKGRCYRGASCRFLHHDADKNESSRHYKSRQYQAETAASSRNSGYHEGVVTVSLPLEHNEVKGEKIPLRQDEGGCLTLKTHGEKRKEEYIDDSVPVQSDLLHDNVEKLVTDDKKSEGYGEGGAQVEGASDESISHRPSAGNHLTSEMDHSPAEMSGEEHQRCDGETQKLDCSTKSNSSTIQAATLSPCGIAVTEPDQGKTSNEPTGPSAPKLDLPHQISHLPPPPLVSQATHAPQDSKPRADYTLMAPPVSFPPPSYQTPLPNQQSHYPVPPNSAWSILPPPQPRAPHMIDSSISSALQFQQGNLPFRNDFPSQTPLMAHSGELPGHSQIGAFQHQTYHLHSSNMPGQTFAGSNLMRDDRFSQFPSQGPGPSASFVPGVPTQPVPFPGDSTVKNMQSFPGSNLPMGESSKPTFQNHQFPQQKLPPYGTPLTAADSVSSHLGGTLSLPAYASDPVGKDHPSRFLDVGGSRISAHYNPYASTFDQPLTSRFSSTAFPQERNAATGTKYVSSFGLSHPPVDGQTAGDHGSRQIIASPKSSRAGGPRSGGDQYDPLFDSIEPSSGSLKNHGQKQDHAADNSEIMLKLSSRHKVLDVAENNKQKEVGAVVATTSLENDEYGETADAEVGAVENGSPSSSPNEDATGAEGEIEIDQVKSEGKSKKSKDSRSMKLFKVSVANFVKEVLKPQWRQGNMSKEVFKTIVKKTVDKVSGAMKSHRLPKSQAKIDHYIDSSRRKLTQLVEGYVSKYKS